jgi:uncharacterized protein YlaN (UPF0358 family)
LDRILVLAQQARDLLVQLADLLLDQLQVVQCQSYEPTIDGIEFGAGAHASRNSAGVARKR